MPAGAWTVRARNADLTLGAQVPFAKLTLVERYNTPDTISVEGQLHALAPILTPGSGALIFDDAGQRVSAVMTSVERRGDGTATVVLTSDLIRLWDRVCYPDPGHAWNAQTTDYDIRTGTAESLLLAYVNVNAGSGALTARRVPTLTLPSSLGRGASTTVTARFDNLGQLAATLAEPSNLRVRVVNQFVGGLARLVLTLDDAPDISAWARYGTPSAGGPGRLGQDWKYGLTAPTVTRSEVAAGGLGSARILREKASGVAETLWGRRIEVMLDQRQTTDPTEIDQAGTDAITQGAGPVAVQVTILDTPGLRVGNDIPVGAVVQADLDGIVVRERIRQVTTTVAVQSSSPTITVEPVFGSPDATSQTYTQRLLASALRRISVIERER